MTLLKTDIYEKQKFEQNNNYCKEYNAEEFVEQLFNEGEIIACDEINSEFNGNFNLPTFYNEKLFKRGQRFFYDNFFVMLIGQYLGLLAVLAVPSIRELLKFTKMSGSEMKSYRRYVATLFHMKIWYDYDFAPGSRLWKSLTEVRKKHNSASKSGCKAGLGRISQKDMALTQFGFMGFVTARGKFIGIHNPDEEDLKGFIHIWRVIGHLLGIEERFNICRNSVEETIQICNLLMNQVTYPEMQKKDKYFLELSCYFANGIWKLVPIAEFKPAMCFLYNLVQKNPDMSKPVYLELNMSDTKLYENYSNRTNHFKSYWRRILYNNLLLMLLWFGKKFLFWHVIILDFEMLL